MAYRKFTDMSFNSHNHREPLQRLVFGGRSCKLPKLDMTTLQNKFTVNPDITVFEFTRDHCEEYSVGTFSTIKEFAEKEDTIRWINSDGFNDDVLETLHSKFNFHSVAIKDIYEDTPQRPNFHQYPGYYFMLFQLIKASRSYDYNEREQISMFVAGNTIISIQEGKAGDSWGEVRKALINPKSKIRQKANVGFLVYTLVDKIVDEMFPIIRSYGDFLEDTEMDLFDDPLNGEKIQQVRQLHRELQMVRRMVAPTKTAIEKMIAPADDRWTEDDDSSVDLTASYNDMEIKKKYHFSANNRAYIREIVDNTDRILDLIDTYKEICVSLENHHGQQQELRTNQTMYTLTVVSTIFLPLTFLAGVYGTNFEKFPELRWEYGYLYFWGLIIFSVVLTLSLLKYKRII